MRIILLILIGMSFLLMSFSAQAADEPRVEGISLNGSFEQFDTRARAGARLNVAFMGGSLTWGANSIDPQRTSYRARVAQWLADRYPKSQIVPIDASIGGTGSLLGIFRLDRDVLSRKPDILFLDFTANDNIRQEDANSLSSYEAIVRRTIAEAKCPVVMVMLPFKADIDVDEKLLKRMPHHLAIADAYGCGVGNAVALIRSMYADQTVTLDQVWDTPTDRSHPGDYGYELFAKAATDGFETALDAKRVSRVPEKMIHPDTYMTTQRARLDNGRALTEGWAVGAPARTGAYFDMQPSRWLDGLVVASAGAKPLAVTFKGSSVGLFGEALPSGGKFRVTIDGKLLPKEFNTGTLSSKAGGPVRFYAQIAFDLDADVSHTLVIEPILDEAEKQTLRFESLLVAGKDASVE